MQTLWRERNVYQVSEDSSRPPYYVLDMFPYPSGAGLHVGHPLGYIASDIFARFKRLQGFNVLHPMGYDAFGLPAEQYAIETGQHPAKTTEENILRYRRQLEQIGFSYDWSREFRTCDPSYYRWTQWIFAQLFSSYYDTAADKARPIELLIDHLTRRGTEGLQAAGTPEQELSAAEWQAMNEQEQSDFLMNFRLAYQGETVVNWCEQLGTVLANDEVSEGLSLRGGYPVVQRKMKQWCLRVRAYAERLLQSLETLEWSDALKETQRNWIGKSRGAEVTFLEKERGLPIVVFTTRPDTLYGVTFMVLAPESELVPQLTAPSQKTAVEEYVVATKRKTERERMTDKRMTGVFTGSYAVHPLTGEDIPIWVGDYVLAGYGTGAIMAVPAHDSRDFAFACAAQLPIRQVVVPLGAEPSDPSTWQDAIPSKEGTLIHSPLIDGLTVEAAIDKMLAVLVEKRLGQQKVNYRLRDAIFSRQRYWGEPFPIYYKGGIPHLLPEKELPLELPEVDSYLPTAEGEPPLARSKNWHTPDGYPYEVDTMPGFAGSSAYYLRYMDPHNEHALVGEEANRYWRHVDLYLGGTEHATGHLIYSRFWNKFLYDLGVICEDEPFKKLVNQGMIQGRSSFVYRVKDTGQFVSYGLKDRYDTTEIHVDINLVDNDRLDLERFRAWRPEYARAEFILEEDGSYLCGHAVEKMSKSMYNVVNPDDIVHRYGADTLRLYEMFLGPLEQSKPWDTKGIDGVHRFLKKLWGLFFPAGSEKIVVTEEAAGEEELKVLHKLIGKVQQDIERFSFNTSVAAFMVCVGELQQLKCQKREVLEPLLIVLSPFAPHITEYLWQELGHSNCVVEAAWPPFEEKYLQESKVKYPVSFNGKVRFTLELPADMSPKDVEEKALIAPEAARWLEGKTPKKIIVVPGRIVNIVL